MKCNIYRTHSIEWTNQSGAAPVVPMQTINAVKVQRYTYVINSEARRGCASDSPHFNEIVCTSRPLFTDNDSTAWILYSDEKGTTQCWWLQRASYRGSLRTAGEERKKQAKKEKVRQTKRDPGRRKGRQNDDRLGPPKIYSISINRNLNYIFE